jgi:hypothetical protein
MLSDKWATQTVAIFDHTIRKRMSTDFSKSQDGGVKVPPAEVGIYALMIYPFQSSKLKPNSSVDSKLTLTRHIGPLLRVFVCILEKTPSGVSLVARPLLAFAMFGDHLWDLRTTILLQWRTSGRSTRNGILERRCLLPQAVGRAKVRCSAITLNRNGTTSPRWQLMSVCY